MAGHVLNCFEIQNADELRMHYRLVRVEGPFDLRLGDGDVAERNLQQLVKRIQYEERIPVAIHQAGAQPILAVPFEHHLHRTEYDLAPDVAVLQPLETSGSIVLSSKDGESERIGKAFLWWHLRSPLFRDHRLWSSGASRYYSKRPLNYRQAHRNVRYKYTIHNVYMNPVCLTGVDHFNFFLKISKVGSKNRGCDNWGHVTKIIGTA